MILQKLNLTEIKEGLSKKKIFRINGKKYSKILIDYSLDAEEFSNFLNIYQILKNVNISIPKIYEVNFRKKIIVMEDFGQNRFSKIVNSHNLYYLLKIAVDNLIEIQNSLIKDDLIKLEKYSFISLKAEISEFIEFYIPFKKIYNFPENFFYNCWESEYNHHKIALNSFVHKDFEFINLILLNNKKGHNKCGIIDFQSAYRGFIGWDLFSILENSRDDFTRKYNEDLIKYFYNNVAMKIDFKSFKDQYYLLNLSRQTRLLGRFAKLFNSTNNREYLNYINSAQKRIKICLENITNKHLKSIYKKFITYDE